MKITDLTDDSSYEGPAAADCVASGDPHRECHEQQHLCQLPGWVGPRITQSILEDILGGEGIEPHCYPEQTSCPDLGCWITLNLTGLGVKRQFFFHADSDAFGRRLITTRDCPFWRTVLSQLVAVVGGTLRNEYRQDPELTIKPTRSRLDLDDDDDYNWLRRRAQRYALDHPDAVGRLD